MQTELNFFEDRADGGAQADIIRFDAVGLQQHSSDDRLFYLENCTVFFKSRANCGWSIDFMTPSGGSISLGCPFGHMEIETAEETAQRLAESPFP